MDREVFEIDFRSRFVRGMYAKQVKLVAGQFDYVAMVASVLWFAGCTLAPIVVVKVLS